ncbi:LysR family transcriptional regulator [Gallaecimonas xiamenensis]|uniref:LysR family transcriptional regulator n=1 Tax=Gallaecimonas xiamenensis 3-C-1 TaxID=745411 RepID=K2IPZ5_9GAMM|nr:LysR family transcriptional regulator [Gallaecimonas xiamenensis]EKE72176.1 LysR family transcriptional regulator [Gallaecimonas xiamenensis 3-C-1]
MNGMPLRALEIFMAVVRLGHFQQAAEALSLTPSAVSHQLKLLEQWAGRPLFLRQGRRRVLTEDGERLHQQVQGPLKELAWIASQYQPVQRQQWRLAVPSAFATKWLIPRLPQFESQYPAMMMSLKMLAEVPPIRDDVADLFITFGPVPGHCYSQDLHRERLWAVQASHLAVEAEELPLLEVLEPQGPSDWVRFTEQTGIDISGRARRHYHHFLLAYEAALCGQGIALVPDFMAADDLKLGRVKRLDWPAIQTPLVFRFLCDQRWLKDPLVRALANWLAKEAQKPLSVLG